MSARSKSRLDQILVERGLAESKAKAQALIMTGRVMVDDQRRDKPGAMVSTDADVDITGQQSYVSRGGDKLASVADQLGLDFSDKTVIDVGASTGGFTDYALQHGAKRVVAVDVGTAQLDWRLRNDPRVEIHEQTDIRNFDGRNLADIALVDVSFVSSLKIIQAVAAQIKPSGQIVVMVKPQFEADKSVADKFQGVISDEEVRQEILAKVRAGLNENFEITAEADSAVLGPKGNRERFLLLKR